MDETDMLRRHFTLLAGTLIAGRVQLHGANALTAQDVAQRIQTALGGEWPPTGPDGFKAGDPDTPVKGIATTAMATLDVLKQASKAGTNLILTYEPTFFGRHDGPAPPPAPASPATNGRGAARGFVGLAADDPVYTAKKEFIEKNGLVVFRLRDHWQARKENDMVTGLAGALGWTKYRVKPDDVIYEIPAATAEDTVALIRKKLNLRGGLRAVGDRKAPSGGSCCIRDYDARHHVAALFGSGPDCRRRSARMGEHALCRRYLYRRRETWARDHRRVASEDPGMRACAAWLKTV